jgi:hypothetical protein
MSLSVGSGSTYIATPPTSDPAKTGGAGSTQKTTGPGKSLTLDNSKGNSGGNSETKLGQGAPQLQLPTIDLSKVDWDKLISTLFTVGEFAFSAYGLATALSAEPSKDNPEWAKLNKWYNEFPDSAYDPQRFSTLARLESYGITRSFLESQGIKIAANGDIDPKELNKLVWNGTKPDLLTPFSSTIDALGKTLSTLFPDSPFVKDLTANLATIKSIATEGITSYLATGKISLSPESTGKLIAIVGMIMQDAFKALDLDTVLTKALQHQPFPGLTASQSQLMTQLLTGSVSLVCIGVAGSVSGDPTAAMDAVIKQFGLTTMEGTAEGTILGILKDYITNGSLSAGDQKALLALFNPSATPNITYLATQTAGIFITLLNNFGTTVYTNIKDMIDSLNQPSPAADPHEYNMDATYATA